ncbi:hypothetical protein Tco_0673704 [Tanacetum coccineum]
MEEDYTPAVQHQRRVNPKIHDVIKKEVEKLLNAGLIYPISDSPWDCPDCEDLSCLYLYQEFSHPQLHFGNPETDIQEKIKKKAKSKQIRARNGKDKVKSQAK